MLFAPGLLLVTILVVIAIVLSVRVLPESVAECSGPKRCPILFEFFLNSFLILSVMLCGN
jgi:hypothetical protein